MWKEERMKRQGLLFILCFFLVMGGPAQTRAGDQSGEPTQSFFLKSLHATGEGMRYWYEEQNGFMAITKIPYAQLGCKNCHVKSCDQCHAIADAGGRKAFSVEKAGDQETCFACHAREKLSAAFAEKAGHEDVHSAAGMSCADCHKGHDVHGDGTMRTTMRDPGTVEVSCENCHKGDNTVGPVFDKTIRSHRVHGQRLDCAACHVRRTMACYNCHFTNFLKTKKKKGNFVPTDDWLMLINYQGKVTSATAMTLIHNWKTFVTYAPYFTHDVMKKGRPCEACHANKAVELLKKGKRIPVAGFVGDELQFWDGVIPIAEDGLEWQFLDKQDGKWVPCVCYPKDSDKLDIVQYSLYGRPLTPTQLKKLQVRQMSKGR